MYPTLVVRVIKNNNISVIIILLKTCNIVFYKKSFKIYLYKKLFEIIISKFEGDRKRKIEDDTKNTPDNRTHIKLIL